MDRRARIGLTPRARVVAALAALVLVAAGCGGDGDGDRPRIVVSAAASLTEAFTQFGKQFEGGDARFSFAGSDVLATQIFSGARPDVYAAANTQLPDRLHAEGLLDGVMQPVRFATNELVLATQAGSRKVASIDDLARPGVRLAIGTDSVPVGSYTQRVLHRLHKPQRDRILANVRSTEPNVTGIVGKLTQGAVDAGFLYATDVKAAGGRLKMIELPPYLQPVVEYAVGIVKGSKQPEAAKRFIVELMAGAGRKALAEAGFGPPPSDLRTQRAGGYAPVEVPAS